jgi:hypothetical protein
MVSGRQVDALLFSIGGNDIGFSGVLEDLVKGDNVSQATTIMAWQWSRRASMPSSSSSRQITTGSRPTSIGCWRHGRYINGYPTALFDKAMPDGEIRFQAFGLLQGWDPDIDGPDYDLIKQKGSELNYLIRRKARQFGWRFIDVAPDFVGHGYCDDNTLWIGATESCMAQDDFDGSMPPSRSRDSWSRRNWSRSCASTRSSRCAARPGSRPWTGTTRARATRRPGHHADWPIRPPVASPTSPLDFLPPLKVDVMEGDSNGPH